MDTKTIEDSFRGLRGHGSEGADDPDFRNAVWREIRHRRAIGETRAPDSVALLWLNCLHFLLPRATVAGLALAVVVAWAVGTIWTAQPTAHRTATTSRVLDLGVFEPHADGMSHNKLIVHR